LAGGARGGSRAAGAGEGESSLGGIEVCAIRGREQGLVAEVGGDIVGIAVLPVDVDAILGGLLCVRRVRRSVGGRE
jgi:hypothetical protein